MNLVDWIGYVGSALIALSLTMRNIWKLRWINLAGAALFTTYGAIIHAWPVVALNGFIVLINLWFLGPMIGRRDYFSLLPADRDSGLRKRFLGFYRADIKRFFPEFDPTGLPRHAESVFVLRNLMPVGLFIYEACAEGTVRIHLDYVIPDFRDFKNAHFMFTAKATELRAAGAREFVAESRQPDHQRYLKRIGFHPDANQPDRFRKPL